MRQRCGPAIRLDLRRFAGVLHTAAPVKASARLAGSDSAVDGGRARARTQIEAARFQGLPAAH